MNYQKGYEQYKGKCERLEKQIKELEDEREGWKQVLEANNAIIAAIVDGIGGELIVKQEAINDALARKLQVESSYDEESMAHTVRTKRLEAV